MLLLVVGPNKVSEYYRPHLKQQIRYVIKLSNNSWQHLDLRTRSEDMPIRTFTLTSEEFLETALQHQLLHFHPNNQKVLPAPSSLFSAPCTLTAWERTVAKSEALILHCSINTGQKTNLHTRFGHTDLIQRQEFGPIGLCWHLERSKAWVLFLKQHQINIHKNTFKMLFSVSI